MPKTLKRILKVLEFPDTTELKLKSLYILIIL